MNLTHWTAHPLDYDPTRTYDQAETRGWGKPRGLWLSDEADFGWKEWCEGEEFHLGGLAHRTEFTLVPGHNVLHIATKAALHEFDRQYSEPLYPNATYARHPDWHRVAEEYDGVLITPLQYETRFDLIWYNGWDVASGCFWNLDAIAPVPACGEVTNHREVTVVCGLPAGHDRAAGSERVHRGEDYGTRVLWLGGTP